ncbi:MAG TPA: membrane-bound O-acyltransferase family protein, partial [Clostridiales bacterium]|nr:membrane-bound O-acyltransferase family protein [Clostridiales bacterium]
MLYNSLQFLLFFPAAVLVYYLTPAKRRYLTLVLISFAFYMCFKPMYALLLLGVTLVTYLAGLAIGKRR